MSGKLIFILTKQSAKGWRFDESQAFINVKLMLSVLLTLNCWAIALLVFGKSRSFNLLGLPGQYDAFNKLAVTAVFFYSSALLIPGRKYSASMKPAWTKKPSKEIISSTLY